MEIERKFLIKELPDNLSSYPHDELCQAYVSTSPVIRVRKKNNEYILTIKSSGMLSRQEMEMAIDEAAFLNLKGKKEGIIIEKTRYKIPLNGGLLIELDLFHDVYEGFCMAEVEFESEEQANTFCPPSWFGEEVTYDSRFFNSKLCKNTEEEIIAFMNYVLQFKLCTKAIRNFIKS